MCINTQREIIIHDIQWLKFGNIRFTHSSCQDQTNLNWIHTSFSSALESFSFKLILSSRVAFKSHLDEMRYNNKLYLAPSWIYIRCYLSISITSAFAISMRIFFKGLSLKIKKTLFYNSGLASKSNTVDIQIEMWDQPVSSSPM